MPTEANNSELFSQIDCVTPSIHLVFCAANTIVRVFLFHFLGPIIAVQYHREDLGVLSQWKLES